MKKGIARIIVGTALILLQIMSFIGNAHAGIGIQISFDSIAVFAYDLVVLISYCFLGIVGVILLVSGIIARSKGKPEDCPPKEEVPVEKSVEEDTETSHIHETPLSEPLPMCKAEKKRFCKLCGGLIDAKSKKCTQCNKQYFSFHIVKKPILFALSIIVVLGIAAFGIYHFSEQQTKDADYLYDWMTKKGTLLGGSCLQYSETTPNGVRFALNYDADFAESYSWYVTCTQVDSSGYTIVTSLTLFWEKSDPPVEITVSGFGRFRDYERSMEYSHKSNTFTKNSPIKQGALSGDTVVKEVFIAGQGFTTVMDKTDGLQAELNRMDSKCSENAQKSLCLILDWLKNSFCPEAKMKMSDFGYENY